MGADGVTVGVLGPVVAWRADMDALPVPELNENMPYKSTVPNVKHACGHDGHTAIALGVAEMFSRMRADLPGTVVFLSPDGAWKYLSSGAWTGELDEVTERAKKTLYFLAFPGDAGCGRPVAREPRCFAPVRPLASATWIPGRSACSTPSSEALPSLAP